MSPCARRVPSHAALTCLPLRCPPSPCSYDWVDEDTIVAAILPEGLGPAPRRPITPLGPKIEVR